VFARVAELQTVLEGVALPAERRELIEYARRQDDGESFVGLLSRIPDREYRSIDEVGEALVSVQPDRQSEPPLPRAESDKPPGGGDYLDPSPEPGAVRRD
jgi:hypothetical protein